jgi:hypothetical protein
MTHFVIIASRPLVLALIASMQTPTPVPIPGPADWAVASHGLSPSQTPIPSVITEEMAFYYYVAIYGAPPDVIDRYARFFDAANYNRAMADEFERGRYRNGIQARIAAAVGRIDFNAKFSYITSRATLGEYSFTYHAFPILGVGYAAGFDYFNYYVGGNGFDLNPFTIENAVNANDFSWSLPMPEAEGSALIKSRPDRRVTVRITYSITRNKVEDHTRVYFRPFIHSIEVLAGDQSRKLGVIPKLGTTAEELRDKSEAPVKLRALLMGHPELDGRGASVGVFTLRVQSFDSAGGSVSAEVDFRWGGRTGTTYDPPLATSRDGHSSRAMGQMSGDSLSLTASWTEKDFFDRVDRGLVVFRLRYDGLARKLVGRWYWGEKQSDMGVVSFDLK